MELVSPELGILFIAILIGLIIGVGIAVFYLLNLQNLMKQVSPELRQMRPGQVWLALIPLFNIVWNFLMIGYIADSVAAEYRKRGMPLGVARPGYQVGLAMAILNVAGMIPKIGSIFSLGGFVLWIIYWVKMAGYRRELENNRFVFPPQGQYGQPGFNQPNYPPQWNNPNPPQNYPPQNWNNPNS
jgi:hypothetical protein